MEISSIYKKHGRTRKVHNLVMLPMGDVLAVGGSSTVYQQASSGPLSSAR